MTPNDLERYKAKATLYMLSYYPRVPNFTLLPDNWFFFYFYTGYNGEFEILGKKALKIRNSKFQKSTM